MIRFTTGTLLLVGALGAGVDAQSAARPTEDKTAAEVKLAETPRPDSNRVVKDRMVKLGLTPGEADNRVKALTDADLNKLAGSPESLEMAGIKDKTLIIIAAILILPSILLLVAL